MFQDADLPCRIVVCFVETAHKIGTPTSNPFAFHRSWKVEQANYAVVPQSTDSQSNLERIVDERFLRLEKQFTSLIASIGGQLSKGKGRGKKSKLPEQSTCQEARDRLANFIDSASASTSRSQPQDLDSDVFTEDIVVEKTYKTIYIKKIDCQLNSNSIDQVEDKPNEDECMQMYWRMFKFNGQLNSLFTNGISYDDFRNGYFFAVFDLSTSGKSGTNYVVPSIRVGHLRIR